MDSLKTNLEDYDKQFRDIMPIDIVVESTSSFGNKMETLFVSKLRTWKLDLMKKFPDKKFKYVKVYYRSRKELDVDSLTGDLHFPCLIDGEKINVPVNTFMRFRAYDPNQ